MKKLTIKFNDGSQVKYEMHNSVDTMPYFDRHASSIKDMEIAIFQQYPKNKHEKVVLVKDGQLVTRITDEKIERLKTTAKERALNEAHDLAINPLKLEDLKLFAFDDDETTYVIADNMDNAIGFCILEIGEDAAKDCIVTEIDDWHQRKLCTYTDENDSSKDKHTTFLDIVKEYYSDGYLNPFIIGATYE